LGWVKKMPLSSFKKAILVNFFLLVAFLYSNISIWLELDQAVAEAPYTSIGLTPIEIIYTKAVLINGTIIPETGVHVIFNWPFWLFFALLAANLLLLNSMRKSKQISQ
jgi:hypothetical protein